MPAYVIATRLRTRDAEELQKYFAAAAKAVTPGQKVLAAYGPQEILEGPPHEGMVIVEFPNMNAARRWYSSALYRRARAHRLNGADYQLTLVEGRAPLAQTT